jgi:hypothetical protein
VWDPVGQRTVTLQPGLVLHSYRIVRFQEPSPYTMEFEVNGQTYRCELAGFQPRTQPVETAEMLSD